MVTILLNDISNPEKEIGYIYSWDSDFSNFVLDKYKHIFKRNKDYHIFPRNRNIRIYQQKGDQNMYQSKLYNPIYVIKYKEINVMIISAHVCSFSTFYQINYDITNKIPQIEIVKKLKMPTVVLNNLVSYL